TMTKWWTVGELAQQAGVSVRALHHYDELGLLTPERTQAGHRRYTEAHLRRLTQIVSLRSLGLSLEEIGLCLDDGEELAASLVRQLRQLDVQVARLGVLRNRLARVVAQLDRGARPDPEDLITLIGETQMIAEGKTKVVEAAG